MHSPYKSGRNADVEEGPNRTEGREICQGEENTESSSRGDTSADPIDKKLLEIGIVGHFVSLHFSTSFDPTTRLYSEWDNATLPFNYYKYAYSKMKKTKVGKAKLIKNPSRVFYVLEGTS